MREQHKSHLISTYTTVLQHLSEVSKAASGKSPGGEALVPLPQPERERLSAGLDAIAGQLKRVLEGFVGGWDSTATGPGGVGVTRMWVNLLLRTVEELIADLSPTRMERRYGKMPLAEAQRLRADVEALLSLVRGMIDS